jgi:hypothetical protein
MMLGSTDFLTMIADNDCRVLFEKGAPVGKLKRDFIYLADRTGKALAVATPQGYHTGPVELHRSIFDDFMAASLIQQDGKASDDKIMFALTPDGMGRGLSISYEEQAQIVTWDEPYDDGRRAATVVADGISLAEAIRRVMAMPVDQRNNVASIGTDVRLYDLSLIEAIYRRADFPTS